MLQSLRLGGPENKYASDDDPYRRRHANAFRVACPRSLTAAVAAITRIPQRMLQHYGEMHKESPFWRVVRILRALRDAGAPRWFEPLRVVADDCGFDLVMRQSPTAAPAMLGSTTARNADLLARVGAVVAEIHLAVADGRLSRGEFARIDPHLAELANAIHATRHHLAKNASGVVPGVQFVTSQDVA